MLAARCMRCEHAIARLGEAPGGFPHRVCHRAALRSIASESAGCRILGVEPGFLDHAFSCRRINIEPQMRGHPLPNRGGQVGMVDAKTPIRIGRCSCQHRPEDAGCELGARHGRDRGRIQVEKLRCPTGRSLDFEPTRPLG